MGALASLAGAAMTFEQLAEYAKRVAVMQGRAFTHPDDDWSMTVIVEHANERPHVIPIPGWVSNDGDAKRVLGWALAQAARYTRPLKVAMIQSTWVVFGDVNSPDFDENLRPKVRPSQHPNRVEQLVVTVIDPEVQHFYYAPIRRRKRRPPVLGEWSAIRDGELDGQLARPLIEAMR